MFGQKWGRANRALALCSSRASACFKVNIRTLSPGMRPHPPTFACDPYNNTPAIATGRQTETFKTTTTHASNRSTFFPFHVVAEFHLEAELLNLVCKDVETEPVLQDITGEVLSGGANTSQEARVDIHARGFWERQRSAFFDVRVCHPNAESYADLSPQQIYSKHENEKKRKYAERILQIEQGTFTPLIFTTTGGMAPECQMFHSRLAELIVIKKAEEYSKTMNWLKVKISFSLIRSALVCLRGSRCLRRRPYSELNEVDIDIQTVEERIG